MSNGLMSFLVVSTLLFCFGTYTVITRKNAIGILLGIELILNAGGLNFVAFSRFIQPSAASSPLHGQVFALFIIVIAAAEVTVALAIILSLFTGAKVIDVDEFKRLKG